MIDLSKFARLYNCELSEVHLDDNKKTDSHESKLRPNDRLQILDWNWTMGQIVSCALWSYL